VLPEFGHAKVNAETSVPPLEISIDDVSGSAFDGVRQTECASSLQRICTQRNPVHASTRYDSSFVVRFFSGEITCTEREAHEKQDEQRPEPGARERKRSLHTRRT
jgi:hypothetical protein